MGGGGGCGKTEWVMGIRAMWKGGGGKEGRRVGEFEDYEV